MRGELSCSTVYNESWLASTSVAAPANVGL